MTKDEALKLALEALEEIHVGNMTPMAEANWNKAITAIKAALAQPAQESLEDLRGALHRIDTVAVGLPTFEVRHEGGLDAFVQNIVDAIVALHEQRKPLTEPECVDEMLKAGFERNSLGWTFTYGRLDYHMLKFARAIEAAHGIKENT